MVSRETWVGEIYKQGLTAGDTRQLLASSSFRFILRLTPSITTKQRCVNDV